VVVLFFATQTVYAAEASCDTKAAEKKLAGAAKNSFIKKCEKDAKVNVAYKSSSFEKPGAVIPHAGIL